MRYHFSILKGFSMNDFYEKMNPCSNSTTIENFRYTVHSLLLRYESDFNYYNFERLVIELLLIMSEYGVNVTFDTITIESHKNIRYNGRYLKSFSKYSQLDRTHRDTIAKVLPIEFRTIRYKIDDGIFDIVEYYRKNRYDILQFPYTQFIHEHINYFNTEIIITKDNIDDFVLVLKRSMNL